MEVPVINRIGQFEAGLSSLQNPPSFLSRAFQIPGIEKIPQAYSFWKWSALILALVATFGSIFKRIKILIVSFRRDTSSASQPLLQISDDEDFSDDDDSDETSSSSYSLDDEEENDPASPVEESLDVYGDFRVAGSGQFDENQGRNRKIKLRRRRSIVDRFSWSEFANGKSVVKLWEGLGLGLDVNNSSGSVISIFDLNKEQNISSIFSARSQMSAVAASSPAVILSAGLDNSRNLALKVWDRRVGCQIPAILAEWKPQLGKVVGISTGGVEKVYVRDDVTRELTVADMRKVSSPLEELTQLDDDTWWDADAVIVTDDCFDE